MSNFFLKLLLPYSSYHSLACSDSLCRKRTESATLWSVMKNKNKRKQCLKNTFQNLNPLPVSTPLYQNELAGKGMGRRTGLIFLVWSSDVSGVVRTCVHVGTWGCWCNDARRERQAGQGNQMALCTLSPKHGKLKGSLTEIASGRCNQWENHGNK